MTQPSAGGKSPASKLASSISKSRQILPDPTNSFKPGTKQSSPVVRNMDQITRIGAQRSMPMQPNPAVQDIRKTKQYRSFARSYALYERVFYDRQPKSLPGVNAFSPAEPSNQPSDISTSNESTTS
ncbi:predicted protein [Uncinocarpus reesii 1704]|uniref:Uncharacterized protein n=1 Tax=Uncinocarpus reesii (strain UAMH 1704) TaxID=336963 RepID=C4JG71_UNCRE|nr:uncharacterized protein UREG_02469 [Uncinocarpus reesii 1704]EEP77620.1 predicted protein [Uncinocarpus reesii 1704]